MKARYLALALGFAAGCALAQALEPSLYEVDGRMSGYLFLAESTRTLQDDTFQNPGTFEVERGARLWADPAGSEGKSCQSCHGAAETSMKGVAPRYPLYDVDADRLVNLELRINSERELRMGAEPFAYESEELVALTAFISAQSHGMPVEVAIDGPAAPYFAQGREAYFKRRGQLDLACSHCHDDLAGWKLRGDVISQGQINGFPMYRLQWKKLASRHRLFEWCNTSLRAEPYPYGSEEYLALELYVAWRGRGLPIETPAVRR